MDKRPPPADRCPRLVDTFGPVYTGVKTPFEQSGPDDKLPIMIDTLSLSLSARVRIAPLSRFARATADDADALTVLLPLATRSLLTAECIRSLLRSMLVLPSWSLAVDLRANMRYKKSVTRNQDNIILRRKRVGSDISAGKQKLV